MTISDINKLFKQLYNIFNPIRPLEEGSPIYVDCQAVRGDVNSVEELSRVIRFADEENTCQLYTGHRGSGKSTELKRLVAELEKDDYYVVYFDVLDDNIDPEDARYTDILIACTRRLLASFPTVDSGSVKAWINERMQDVVELGQSGIVATVDSLGLFTQLATRLKAVPTFRHEIRKKLDPHTPSLLAVLNEFIRSIPLPSSKKGLVLIVDSLDRIVPIKIERGQMNHDEIFVDRSEQLKGLACHVIYTVPISMLYSGTANHLGDRYGKVKVLPMVKVRERSSQMAYQPGIQAFKELLEKRLQTASPELTLKSFFAEEETVTKLCLTSGGIARELIYLMRSILEYAPPKLPIANKSAQRAIAELRDTYRRMIFADHWKILAEVHAKQAMPNRDEYRKLLYDRCILEYRQLEPDQSITTWHDVHPILVETEEFQSALKTL